MFTFIYGSISNKKELSQSGKWIKLPQSGIGAHHLGYALL
jgi:hypothetical protein